MASHVNDWKDVCDLRKWLCDAVAWIFSFCVWGRGWLGKKGGEESRCVKGDIKPQKEPSKEIKNAVSLL